MIVGAGSAGCALAARLSEDPSTRVLLLEAGPSDRVQEVSVPAAFSRLFKTERDWGYTTVPQEGLYGRSLYWPRGRVLGGSSSINAMMWVRGVPLDYDQWQVDGWRYEDLVPYFTRVEDSARPGAGHVGAGGPVRIEDQREPNPATRLFVEACVAAGLPRNPNANAGDNLGIDFTQVNQRRGARMSMAAAYLAPARKRPNLTVQTGATATRVVIEGGRAVGVTYLTPGGLATASARREVVLAGGAVNSPQLLMLSGIGPAGHLRSVGIEPLVDLPAVGENLFDHLAAGFVVSTPRTDTLVAAESPSPLLRYLVSRRGLRTSNVGEAHAFLRTGASLPAADVELIFAPAPFLDHGLTEPPGHGLTVGVVLLQPRSRGTVRLASPDPTASPLIDPRYLDDPDDLRVLVAGLKEARRILETDPLAGVVGGLIRPDEWPTDDAAYADLVRRHAETLYHPVGTCRMGADEESVVDPELRVRGVAGLRVVDASVMPYVNRGHTNAPAVMIGERAADLIRGSV